MDMTTNLIAAAPVRLLILDCDGVLIDSEPLAAQADALAIWKTSRTGVRPSADELMRRFTGKSSAAMVGLLRSDYGVEDVGAWVEAKARVLDELFRRSLRPVRGVLETLAAFDEAGLAFCVASNSGRTRLRTAFEATGLTDRLRGRWFSAEEVSEGKPAPDLHLHVWALRLRSVWSSTTVPRAFSVPGAPGCAPGGSRVSIGLVPLGNAISSTLEPNGSSPTSRFC